MTQAFNLSQLANNVNTTGQLNAAAGLYNQTPVANGGTGAATLAANAVLLGNGTSALQTVAASTLGNVLTSNGTTWVSQASSGGTPVVTIYSAPATWTKSPTLKAVKVFMVAAGGSGGSGTTNPALSSILGGPGGNGGILQGFAQASAIPGPLSITVGSSNAGGTNGTPGTPSNPGVTGGTSSFGTVFSTTGGGAGTGQSGPTPGVAGAPGGSYTITTTPTTSSLELTSPTATPVQAYGVRGLTGPTTKNASGYGMGGAGTAGPAPGGSSSGGFMIVEEFY